MRSAAVRNIGLLVALGFAVLRSTTGCSIVPKNQSGTLGIEGSSSGSVSEVGEGGVEIDAGFPTNLLGCDGGTLPTPSFGPVCNSGTTPPPISGGTLLVTHNGILVVIADPDRDLIYIVDVSQGQLLFTIALQAGDEPGRLVEDAAGLVHVALRSGGALVTVNPTTGTIVGRRAVCPAPRGVAFDATRNLVWVACATGELVGLPPAGGAATTNWVVERDLRDVIVSSTGALTVSSFRAAQLLSLNDQGGIVNRTQLPAPDGAFSPHVLWRTVPAPGGGLICVHQEHSETSIDTQMPGGYGGGCGGVFPTPSGGSSGAVGSGSSSGGEFVVEGDGGAGFVGSLPAEGVGSSSLGPMGSVLTTLGADGSIQVNRTFDGVLPVDVAVSAQGNLVFATPGSAYTQSSAFVSWTASGGTQVPLPFSTDNLQAIAVGWDAAGEALVQTRDPAMLWGFPQSGAVGTGGPLGPLGGPSWSIPLSSISRCDTGHDVFHTHAGVAIACASCHPEGGDDGHVWILDGDQRRTPSLRGTIAGTAPYHWPGDEADLPVLVNNVYTLRMAGGTLAPAEMGALTSWVQSIPPPPAPSWVNASAAAAGRTLFESAAVGCAVCHSGPKLTNNQTLDVGTGGAFQVPPLVGVGWRTPLLHNGCASTIADRFGACSTPQHGTLSSLSATDLSNLEAYLETL